MKKQLTRLSSTVESINQFTAGTFDGCVMTNMDMLTIPAAGGVDSTALIVGDFSNGNDGVVIKGKGKTLSDLKGQKINLVELSVSHYLLARALSSVGSKMLTKPTPIPSARAASHKFCTAQHVL